MSQTTTQNHLNISSIKEDLVILKDGGASLIIETNAVNFGLLSEMEQFSIITSFAQMLNSLSYSIQIVIQSQRLDVSSYITMLENVQKLQTNPLLTNMIAKYRAFVQSLVKENEVLDKQFYIILNISSIEIGLGFLKEEEKLVKARALLTPRRDQIIRQLTRLGLSAKQLTTLELIKLFYSVYNQSVGLASNVQNVNPANVIQQVKLTNPQSTQVPPSLQQNQIPRQSVPQNQSTGNIAQQIPQQFSSLTPTQRPFNRNHPFVVEELSDAI